MDITIPSTQRRDPGWHTCGTQAPSRHDCPAPHAARAVVAMPLGSQTLGVFMSRQPTAPGVHIQSLQRPETHVCRAVHAVAQLPQCRGSLAVSAQRRPVASAQSDRPAAVQVTTPQRPSEQTCPVAQARPHAPQSRASPCRSTQRSPHRVRPDHEHEPSGAGAAVDGPTVRSRDGATQLSVAG